MERAAALDEPWTRTLLGRLARELLICGVFGPIIDAYTRTRITGRGQLEGIPGPAIFVANHCSHIDTPLLLRSLPARWRRRTAVVAAADYFYANRVLAAAVSLAFGTVPLERNAQGNGAASTPHLEQLIETGWSLVVFAEGTRSRDGHMAPMRSGAAVLAARHGVPIVPVHLLGSHAAMAPGRRWLVRPPGEGRLARHAITLDFGAPIPVHPGDDRLEVMEQVRRFMTASGAQTS